MTIRIYRQAWFGALMLVFSGATAALAQSQDASGQWVLKAPLPSTWTEMVSVAYDGKIYAFDGGFPAKADVAVYDPANNTWQLRKPMPLGLDHIGTAVLDGKIYIVGGFTKNRHIGVNDSVFEYDPANDQWRKLASLSAPRGSVAAAAIDGKIHAFGGRKNETDVVADHEVYDPKTGKWSPAPPLPRGRDHMAAAVVDGKIHVVGGRFGANEDSTTLHDVFDPKTAAWTSGPAMPLPRGGGSGTFFHGMIVYLGGEDDTHAFNESQGFDVKTNKWVALPPMLHPVHGIGVSAIGNTLYVSGGGRSRGNREVTDAVMALTLP